MPSTSTSVAAAAVRFTVPTKSLATLSSVTSLLPAAIVVVPVIVSGPLSVTLPPAVRFKAPLSVTVPRSMPSTSTSVAAAAVMLTEAKLLLAFCSVTVVALKVAIPETITEPVWSTVVALTVRFGAATVALKFTVSVLIDRVPAPKLMSPAMLSVSLPA